MIFGTNKKLYSFLQKICTGFMKETNKMLRLYLIKLS